MKTAIAILIAAISISGAAFAEKRQPEQTDDVMSTLIPLLDGKAPISKPIQMIGSAEQNIKSYTRADGPIFYTARLEKRLDKQCGIIVLKVDVHNTLTTSGKKVTYTGYSPIAICPDGKPPQHQLRPDQIAFVNELARELQQLSSMSKGK